MQQQRVPPMRAVTTYYKDHTDLVDGYARFAVGERVRDTETGHQGHVDSLFGPGPQFTKLLVRYDNGVRRVVPDTQLQYADDHHVVAAVAGRFSVPAPFVANVLTQAPDIMKARDVYFAPVNGTVPVLDYPRYPRYTPKLQAWLDDPMDSYVDYLEMLDPFEVIPSEAENGIRNHWTFQLYVEWYRAGHLPPYPSVFEQIRDGERKLLGAARRRILTAREAGIHELPVWLGRWNTESGLPLKYGDILKAAALA